MSAVDPDDEHGSVTNWIDNMRKGDPDAAQALWDRYFQQLVQIARAKRGRRMSNNRAEDEEDAALSAFQSVCAGLEGGRFPRLNHRDDLWRLLIVITARKVSAQYDREKAQKRGGQWRAVEAGPGGEEAGRSLLDELSAEGPTPEFAAIMAEETERLLARLGDAGLRQIAIWRLEGHDRDEIAEKLNCARRTVARRLELIRTIWSDEAP